LITLLLTACSFSVQLPDGRATQIGQDALAVAHPMASFSSASVVGASAGGCGTGAGDRFVDIAIDYSGGLAKKTETMTVRFLLKSLEPCEITTDVLSDTGPMPPILLDNWLASPLLGASVCEAFGAN
jgi:hypothetical protein